MAKKHRSKCKSRKQHLGGKGSRKQALVILQALAIQVLSVASISRQRRAKVEGWRQDIRFLGSMKGMWRAVFSELNFPKAQLQSDLRQMDEVVRRGGRVNDALQACVCVRQTA